jgi:hypothetical protein
MTVVEDGTRAYLVGDGGTLSGVVEGSVDGVDVIFDGKDTGCASGGGTPRGGKKALGNFNACLKEGVDSVLFGAVRGDKCQFSVQFLGVFSNACTVKMYVRPLFFRDVRCTANVNVRS